MGLDWMLPVLISAAGLMIGSYIHTMRSYRRYIAANMGDGLVLRGRNRNHIGSGCENFGKAVR